MVETDPRRPESIECRSSVSLSRRPGGFGLAETQDVVGIDRARIVEPGRPVHGPATSILVWSRDPSGARAEIEKVAGKAEMSTSATYWLGSPASGATSTSTD